MKRQRSLELGTLSRSHVARTTFRILDAIQDEPLEYMLLAIGMTLEALCEVKRLSRSDVMTVATNMLSREDEAENYVRALRSFIKDEVPDVRRT